MNITPANPGVNDGLLHYGVGCRVTITFEDGSTKIGYLNKCHTSGETLIYLRDVVVTDAHGVTIRQINYECVSTGHDQPFVLITIT